MNVIGEVQGCNCVVFDDVISTGKTIALAAEALRGKGAKEIYVGATHAAFSDQTASVLEKSPVREVVVTDSVYQPPGRLGSSKIKVKSVNKLLGEAIRRIHEERSLSSLFV